MSRPVYSIAAPDQLRLKVARAEIEAVLKKHDLAGVVALHTPGMAEFFYDITPSYSCAWIDEAAGILRVKSKRADYASAEEQERDQTATANMASLLSTDLNGASVMFRSICSVLDKALRAEHSNGSFSPDVKATRQ